MKKFNPSQKILFPVKHVFNVKEPLDKCETLFSFLNLDSFKNLYSSTGRPHIFYESILKALIFKNLRGLSSLSANYSLLLFSTRKMVVHLIFRLSQMKLEKELSMELKNLKKCTP